MKNLIKVNMFIFPLVHSIVYIFKFQPKLQFGLSFFQVPSGPPGDIIPVMFSGMYIVT